MNPPESLTSAAGGKIVKLPVPTRLKVLKSPPLSAGEGKSVERLKPTAVTPISDEEARVVDAFIRLKRVEARVKARARALQPTLFAILKGRQALKRRGARLGLKNHYDYTYSTAISLLEESLDMARVMERQLGLAKAEVTETIAFEDIDAKALKKKGAGAAEQR